jgi:hypothetical protein
MKSSITIFAIAGIFGSILTGCVSYTTYNNLKPISPKPEIYTPIIVDSLEPVFKWQTKSPDQKVDLAIWEAFKSQSVLVMEGAQRLYDVKGDVVYNKKGIVGGEHRIEKNLMPDAVYFWSIKPTGTTDWASANSHFYNLGIPYAPVEAHATTLFFLIRTPKN